jgi:hypothetical protein
VRLFHPSLGFLAEEQPRLENKRRQKARFWVEVHIKFFRRPHEHKAIGKITNLFCVYFFQIHR